jgi:hypothetical protein
MVMEIANQGKIGNLLINGRPYFPSPTHLPPTRWPSFKRQKNTREQSAGGQGILSRGGVCVSVGYGFFRKKREVCAAPEDGADNKDAEDGNLLTAPGIP